MPIAINQGTDGVLRGTGIVAGGNTVRQGMPVVITVAGNPPTIQESVAQGTQAIGIAETIENQANTQTPWTAAAGTLVNFIYLGQACIAKVRCSGAATQGNNVVAAANGVVDLAFADGVNATTIIGTMAETGAVNELRGCYLGTYARCNAA